MKMLDYIYLSALGTALWFWLLKATGTEPSYNLFIYGISIGYFLPKIIEWKITCNVPYMKEEIK